MVKDKYAARILKPEKHTTSKGGSYITPFDLIRSDRGRKVVDRHARFASVKTKAEPKPPQKPE